MKKLLSTIGVGVLALGLSWPGYAVSYNGSMLGMSVADAPSGQNVLTVVMMSAGSLVTCTSTSADNQGYLAAAAAANRKQRTLQMTCDGSGQITELIDDFVL